jgi:hypothetical protein
MSETAADRYPKAEEAGRAPGGAELEALRKVESAEPIRRDQPSAELELRIQSDQEARLRFSVRFRKVLAELVSIGPPSEGLRMLAALVASEKRRDSLLAFVPLVGLWVIERSKYHSLREKKALRVLSLGLSLVVLTVASASIPSDADRLAGLRERMQREMRALNDVAERYRREHGFYPDGATWKWLAGRADGRFFDPWGRPYRYEARVDGVSFRALGRDGREGGVGSDADVMLERLPQAR